MNEASFLSRDFKAIRKELVLKLDSSRTSGESRSEVNTPTNRPQSPTKKKRSKEAPEIGASKKKTSTVKRAKSAAPSAYRRIMQQVESSPLKCICVCEKASRFFAVISRINNIKLFFHCRDAISQTLRLRFLQTTSETVSALPTKTKMKKSPSADLDAVKKSKITKKSVTGKEVSDVNGGSIPKSTSCNSDLAGKGGDATSGTSTTVTMKRTKSPCKQVARPPWTNYFS